MDILDIDEALKDDSYIFLADKTHDDVSNILQQWKANNQPQLQLQLQAQCNNDGSTKSNASGSRLSVTLKAHVSQQPQLLNDLRKNLQDKNQFQDYVRTLLSDSAHIAASDVDPVLDTISVREEEPRLATVTGWSTVKLTNCAGVPNDSIFLALKWVLMPLKVEVFDFKRSGKEDNMAQAQFLVDNLLSANRLKRLQHDLAVLYTCQKLDVQVTLGLPLSVKNITINSMFTGAIEAALRTRYQVATRTLDLSRFHASPELGQYFCPLHVVRLLENVLLLVRQWLPLVAGIVLSNNYLCSLKAFAGIADGLDDLERLDISANRINKLDELKFLRKLRLKKLLLSGNGVAKMKSSEIRALLPQLQDVHGCVMTIPDSAVVDTLPKYQRLHSGGTKGLEFCNRFAASYYDFFDDPSQRPQLKQYYHDQAMFSLSVPDVLGHVYAYKLYNRNQKRTQSSFARNAKLQLGCSAIFLAFSRLPSMRTDYHNVALDIQVFADRLRIFTLTGCIQEDTVKGCEPRHFQRTFVLRLLESPGWLITNDMLCIVLPNVVHEKDHVHCRPEETSTNEHITLKAVEPKPKQATNNAPPSAQKPQEASNSPSSYIKMERLDHAVQQLSLSKPKMAICPDKTFGEMPPLVSIANEVRTLEQAIDDTSLSDEETFELVIDEDVLIGDDDF